MELHTFLAGLFLGFEYVLINQWSPTGLFSETFRLALEARVQLGPANVTLGQRVNVTAGLMLEPDFARLDFHFRELFMRAPLFLDEKTTNITQFPEPLVRFLSSDKWNAFVIIRVVAESISCEQLVGDEFRQDRRALARILTSKFNAQTYKAYELTKAYKFDLPVEYAHNSTIRKRMVLGARSGSPACAADNSRESLSSGGPRLPENFAERVWRLVKHCCEFVSQNANPATGSQRARASNGEERISPTARKREPISLCWALECVLYIVVCILHCQAQLTAGRCAAGPNGEKPKIGRARLLLTVSLDICLIIEAVFELLTGPLLLTRAGSRYLAYIQVNMIELYLGLSLGMLCTPGTAAASRFVRWTQNLAWLLMLVAYPANTYKHIMFESYKCDDYKSVFRYILWPRDCTHSPRAPVNAGGHSWPAELLTELCRNAHVAIYAMLAAFLVVGAIRLGDTCCRCRSAPRLKTDNRGAKREGAVGLKLLIMRCCLCWFSIYWALQPTRPRDYPVARLVFFAMLIDLVDLLADRVTYRWAVLQRKLGEFCRPTPRPT